ncbi:hypothetical protein [Xenorhabdus ehlersii]|uniref:Uncharacterized protein n=1 Tax=Xenorhabdus ehlersii TaxID=290111 RepID=A0A2D0ILH9_9GAMM|nr:hypothetical protein [Xenorhabdus ehlersii]PHM22644.1 hypothetical protein Xehl_03520 [Xenorhabdus ehlersii]RKE91820.1 hypothetical protein BDE27_2097 [Xenorhabdus ehlersii]
MTTYVCVFEPIQEAQQDGAVSLAIALEANSIKMAKALAIVHLGDEYPENMDKFNTDTPIICEDRVGSPRPPVGKFDEKFAAEYEFNGTTWQARSPKSAQAPEIHERGFTHTYTTLDLEIALALVDGDFYCWEIRSREMSAAKKLMADNDEVWRRWSTAFRIRTDALSIPRETIFKVVREGKQHPEFLADANAMKAFLNHTLGDTSIAELQDKPNEPASIPETSAENITADEVETQTVPEVKAEKSETKPRKTRKTKPAKKETVPETEEIAPEANENEPEIEKIVPKTKNTAPKTAANDEITPLPSVSGQNASNDNFQHRADLLEETIKAQGNEQQANLRIWKAVQRTDPRFTKPLEGVGYTGTSINSNYMLMRATEQFGPAGGSWGYQVLEDKMLDGAPMTEPVYDANNKQTGFRLLRDGDGTLICEQNHSIKILLWYPLGDGTRGEIESYGATPYRYKTKNGIKTDGEVIKKSLTDAIKKALSMLGFSADVFMGMYDNPEYLAENKIEFGIKAASDKAEDLTRLRKELDDKFARNTETMKTAITKNELRGIASTLTREIDVHLKNAKSLGDKEYERYLSGRLRRLTEIEKDCLTKLEEANQ